MAQLITEAQPRQKGRNALRIKRAHLKIDMTPMVDLGFLLIAFFIYTTSISDPVVTKLNMPKESNVVTKSPESNSLTFILDSENKVYYYQGTEEGLDAVQLKETNWVEASGFGKIIRDKKQAMEAKEKGSSSDLFVLIKSAKEASYENVINALDEMKINGVTRYALDNSSKKEENLILFHQ